MTIYPVTNITIKKVENGTVSDAVDLLATEEPMEVRIGYGEKSSRLQKSISVTMRTPGNDFELALGFLYTEGIIKDVSDISQIRYCTDANTIENKQNIVRVELKENIVIDFSRLQRNFYTTSSCGVCGKESIDAIKTSCPLPLSSDNSQVYAATILSLPEKLRQKQAVFEHTGGLHASAFFSLDGTFLMLREDVGRHNALDKLIGAGLGLKPDSFLFGEQVLLLSGRTSFELIQKAAMAGIRIVCAVGAPSSLAVTLANEYQITLIGFLRENRFNIYSHPKRIIS